MCILYYLYEIKNNINGKIYIGVHQSATMDDGYMGSGIAIKAAIQKYGIKNFTKTILENFSDAQAMYNREKEIVDEDFLARIDVYNLTLGGQGGFNHINSDRTPEYYTLRSNNGKKTNSTHYNLKEFNNSLTFDERSARSKKAAQTQIKTKGYFDNGWTGKTHSQESIAKSSVSMKGRHTGKENSQFGSCWVTHAEFGNKKIKLTELDSYVSLGYNKGRKM